MAFSDLTAKAEQLQDAINQSCVKGDDFDDCTVALIGNRYKTVGYDDYEEDYYALTGYEQDLAQTESGKWLMRMTKAEMISTIGQCVGIVMAFIDLRQSYDYLKATMDILKDENTSLLDVIREIDRMYDDAEAERFDSWRSEDVRKFNGMIDQLPDRIWIE